MQTDANFAKFNLDSKNSLLMLIDIQQKLLPAMHEPQQLVNNTLKLLQGLQLLDVPILLTEQYPQGLGATITELSNWINTDNLYIKTQFSAITVEVKQYLQQANKSSIIICGIETHVCVLQTIRDLLKLGYNVQVVTDCVTSRTADNKQNGLQYIQQMGAVLTNLETCLFDLTKTAANPKFRELSKIIK